MKILIVEDNRKMADAIRKGLSEHGYTVEHTISAVEGEELGAEGGHDLVLLDVMLPDGDGVQVCRNLRRRGLSAPIIMLTALSGSHEKITGLDAGADDYVTKPFDFEELVARIRAQLRRGKASDSTHLSCGDLKLDLGSRSVTRGERTVSLSGKEFMLLEYFLRNQDKVLTRQVLAQNVWGLKFEPTSNVIDVYVSALRRKIDKGHVPLIHTVIGAGYRFGEVHESSGD